MSYRVKQVIDDTVYISIKHEYYYTASLTSLYMLWLGLFVSVLCLGIVVYDWEDYLGVKCIFLVLHVYQCE